LSRLSFILHPVVKKETYPRKFRVWLYWPFWLLLVLIALLVILLVRSKEKSETIDDQLNDRPASVK
jgi:hypothetical protein